MKLTKHGLLGAGLLASAISLTAVDAAASSHREAPAITEDPAADNTDVYAWVEPGTRDKLYILANYNPLQEPAGGPNFHQFSDDVRYAVHIARGADSLDDAVTYYIEFDSTPLATVDPADLNAAVGGGKEFFKQLSGVTQSYTVTKVEGGNSTVIAQDVEVAPINIGPRTQAVVHAGATYDDAFAAGYVEDMGAEGRVWAGPRDDGFYVDLGGVFDLANLRAKGTAQDGVSGFNVHTIALEIPTQQLTFDGNAPAAGAGADNTLGIWASAERRKVHIRQFNGQSKYIGPWVQVSRLGLPLVNEALIGLQDKDKFNATHPRNDVANFGAYFVNPVVVRDAEAVGIYTALGADPTPFKSGRTDILDIISLNDGTRTINTVGDVLRVDLGIDSQFPNGRAVPGGAAANQEQVDVTDVLLTVILSGGAIAISDGVDYNDVDFLTSFPFLALPHEGYAGGHGTPTP